MNVAFLVFDAAQFSAFHESVELSSLLALVVILLHRSSAGFFVLHLYIELSQLVSKLGDLVLKHFGRLFEVLSFDLIDFLDEDAPLELGVVKI